MIFCFYPVDILLGPDDARSVHLRSTPFDSHYLAPSISTKSAQSTQSMSSFLEHDASNHIYFLSLGTLPSLLSIPTPSWKWPARYTVLLWIRWPRTNGIVTTFDSDAYSPIFVNGGRLGCAGQNASGSTTWDVLRYKVVPDEWQCVIAEGGGHSTVFRVGDLRTVPTVKGVVSCDVAGRMTRRLGNGQYGGQVRLRIRIYPIWIHG